MRESEGTEVVQPRPFDVLPIILIVGVVTAASRLVQAPLVGMSASLGLAAASAALMGVPVLFWALDHGRTRLEPLVALGGVTGALPLLLVLASGILGRLRVGGVPWVREVLGRGVPIPFVGLTPWSTFLGHEAGAILIGAASGAIYWIVFVKIRTSL